MRPLKILQIVSGRDVNGAVVHCGLLSHRLAKSGHDITVAVRPNSWFPTRFASDEISIVCSPLKRRMGEIYRMAAFVRKNNFDLIHTHMSSAHSFGIILKWLTGVPCIATAHNCRFQLHWCLNNFVIANSRSTQKFQQRTNRVRENRIKTVYCYSDLQRFVDEPPRARTAIRCQQKVPVDSTLVGIVGDICNRKGHIYLAQAIPELAKRFPDLTILFVGNYQKATDKYVNSVRKILVDNKVADRVKWLGRRDDIPKLVKSFDVSIIPSVEEPLGLVAMEALAAGTPVVASETGGLPEIIKHEETGILIPSKNPQAIVEGVSRLLADSELSNKLSRQGIEFVQVAFCPKRLTEQVEEVYSHVVDGTDLLPETYPASNNCQNRYQNVA